MNNVSIGTILVIAGLISWALLIIGVGVDLDLWVLGWLLIVLGWLLGVRSPA